MLSVYIIFLFLCTADSFIIKTFFNFKFHGLKNLKLNGLHPFVSSPNNVNGALGQSFIHQKNEILMIKFIHPENGNLTNTAMQYVNYCDESFDHFLSTTMDELVDELIRQKFGKIRYEINIARRVKLNEADKILRNILSAGGLKQMEAKLSYYLRRYDIDMAFMVILQLNIEDALHANVTTAVQLMKHLETLINEHQDSLVSSPVRLLRMLLRANDSIIRKQMLRQKLLYMSPTGVMLSAGEIGMLTRIVNSSDSNDEILPTPSAQCEHIFVDAVKTWGKPEVTFQQLEETMDDVLSQV